MPIVRLILPALVGAVIAPAQRQLPEPLPRDVLRGTVIGADGVPVAGATVELHRRLAQGFTCLDLPFSRTTRRVQTLRTGRNGTFATQVPRGVPFELHLDDGVHAPIRRREVYAGEDVPLPLVAPARVALALQDEHGKPCPGGTLEAWDEQHVRWIDAAIDDQGHWQSDRLPPGPMTFDIAPASAERPQWQKLTLEAGVTTPIELQLLPGCILRGRVTDQDTGKPIAGARIGEGWTMDKYVETDADGRYEMRGYGSYGYGEVRVTAPDYGPQLRRLPKQADGVTADFALQRGCEVTGRTVDAAGKPVAGAYVAAVGFSGDGTFDWSGSTTDADGRYRLRGLRHEVEHALIARADGFASLVGDLPSLRPEPTALPDVTLRPARYVSGVVVDAEGKPVAGVQVWLRGNNADRAQLLGGADGGDTHGADYCIAVREMKTDSLGRIHFADVAPGSYQLLQRDGQSEQLRAVEVLAERDPEPTRLER